MNQKHLLILFLAVCGSMNLRAQGLKHSFLIDGNLKYSISNSRDPNIPNNVGKTTDFEVSPNIGFFVSDRILLGAGIRYQLEKTKTVTNTVPGNVPFISTNELSTRRIGPAFFIRHLVPISSRLYYATNLNFHYGWERTKIVILDSHASGSNKWEMKHGNRMYNIALSPELLFMLTNRLGLQANFNGFNLSNYKRRNFASELEYTDFEFQINPTTWKVGVFALLGKTDRNFRDQ